MNSIWSPEVQWSPSSDLIEIPCPTLKCHMFVITLFFRGKQKLKLWSLMFSNSTKGKSPLWSVFHPWKWGECLPSVWVWRLKNRWLSHSHCSFVYLRLGQMERLSSLAITESNLFQFSDTSSVSTGVTFCDYWSQWTLFFFLLSLGWK